MATLAGCSASSAVAAVDFSREVLPILSSHCLPCHGRDPLSREGKLRLDVREDALRDRDGFRALVPHHPESSELIARITSPHEDERMPPADKGRALNPTEIETLRTWIAEGAPYSEHWAFKPLERPELPATRDAAWPQSPVDRFVLARLEKERLRPAPAASRETLIRRASLDLLGLLPAPGEIAAFRDDPDTDAGAFARLVDRLLASPHYGERWGRHWLDVARYADSGGFETDLFFGHAWRYRDYVVRSFNADKPFNRFIQEQIAGDELFPGDEEARLGTGLYTTGPVLQEAGMVSGKLEYDQNTDFVDTTGAAFLGLTLGCARCHDHKYDPVSQREYFSLQAIFAASDQFDFAADGAQLRDRAALRNTQKEFEAERTRSRVEREKDPARRAELLREAGDAFVELDPALKYRADSDRRYRTVEDAVAQYRAVVQTGVAASFVPDPLAPSLDDRSETVALKAVLTDLRNELKEPPEQAALFQVGIVALLKPVPAKPKAPRDQPKQKEAVASPAPAPAEPATTATAEPATVATKPPAPAATDRGNPQREFNALKTSGEKRAWLIDFGRRQLTLAKPAGYIEDTAAWRLAIGEKNLDVPTPIPFRSLSHREKPLETRLFQRGELDRPGDVVEAGVPEMLAGGFRFDDVPPTRRRAALAEWIASEQNLLTARVIANRVWQWHFGEGLVRTPNDFGIRGEPPSHPELLDWLATELIAQRWSLKHLHRVIMNSRAYQMAATADAATLERDPDNVLLTRFQPHRLQAEIVWDNLRAAAGTLDLTLFGLPIAPPLDDQERFANARRWPASTPEESNRRALYILVRRSVRFPMLNAFDLPDNISSCGRRDITTVPNQALTLLNNRTIHQQAAAFADRLLRETNGEIESIAKHAWLLAYGRAVTVDESAKVREFLASRGGGKPAIAELCLALFNTNEFIYQQ